MLSASKEIELGARAMLLLAEGLFRFDICVSPDTIRTTLRNLSSGALAMEPVPGYSADVIVFGEADAYRPSHTSARFRLGTGGDQVSVNVTVGTLHFRERGTVRVTGQAIITQELSESA